MQGRQTLAVSRGEEAEVAHLDKAFWENVLEEAVDECLGGEGAELELTGIGSVIAEGDMIILEFDKAAVADGDAEDIGSEVFEGGAAVADFGEIRFNNQSDCWQVTHAYPREGGRLHALVSPHLLVRYYHCSVVLISQQDTVSNHHKHVDSLTLELALAEISILGHEDRVSHQCGDATSYLQ